MDEFILKDDFIKLGQLLKATNMVSNGADAKFLIQDGQIKLNGNVETQRGKKIVRGDIVEYKDSKVVVK